MSILLYIEQYDSTFGVVIDETNRITHSAVEWAVGMNGDAFIDWLYERDKNTVVECIEIARE